MQPSARTGPGATDEVKFNFSEVSVLLIDHDLATREAVKGVIHENGFRDIRTGT